MNLPWIEKYRPQKIEDVVGNKYAIQQFKIISQAGNMPHMILTGPPGTGKTTSVICLAKTLLKDHFQNAYLELNASDERGIDVIRNKIIFFCKKKMTLPDECNKIIFLDEIDSMTNTAQQALRRIIELYTNSTRFAMACNSSAQIIEAIQSRCAIFRFARVGNEEMAKRLGEICQAECVEYEKEGLESVILSANGDMRRALNNIQSVNTIFSKITPENVTNTINQPSHIVIRKVIEGCLENRFSEVDKLVSNLIGEGYAAGDVIKLLFLIAKEIEMEGDKKLRYLKAMGKTEINIVQGADPYLQLVALTARLCLL